jgi:hypothetical protein
MPHADDDKPIQLREMSVADKIGRPAERHDQLTHSRNTGRTPATREDLKRPNGIV